jgi:hypothetical protein
MNKKILASSGIIILIFIISMRLGYVTPIAMAELDPNYGTTTFFSEKNEIPSANPPIYDVGVSATNNSSSSKSDNNNSTDEESINSGGLFSRAISSIGVFFGGSSEQINTTEDSLFSWQQNSDTFGDSSDSSGGGEFVMGARGESLENIDDEEAAKYNDRIANGFNFRENSSNSTPKKSKLLFTNIVVPVNMTTQYILIGFVFFIAIGLAVGYYLWKKEKSKAVINSNEDYQ